MVYGSGLQPFQFDTGRLPTLYMERKRSIPIWTLLAVITLAVIVVVGGTLLYYSTKGTTFNNSVRSDTQLAMQNIQFYLNNNPATTQISATTPGLNLPAAHGTQYAITGPDNTGFGSAAAYEIHAWNPRSSAYPDKNHTYTFSSLTNKYING